MNARAQRVVLGRRVVALGLSWVMAATSVWSVAPPVRAAGPAPSLQPVVAWAVPALGSPAAVAAAAAGAAPAVVAPALVASAASGPVACDWSALRPTRFVRTKGAPNTYTTTFDVPGWVTAPQALRVRNGEPNGAFRVSSATIKVGGTTIFSPSDFNTQVATLERAVTLSPRTTLTVTLASAPGSYLTIEACGTNGDATPPTIAVAEPAAAAFLSDPTPRLRVTYQDAPPGLVSGVDPATLVVKVDGVDRTALFTRLSAEATAAWPEAEPLAPGPHAIEVEVRDRAGNPASAQSSFTIDTQAPQVTVAEPAAGASLATLQPTLRVTYADDLGLDLATLRLRIDGADRTAEFAVGPGAAAATLALAAGPHVLQAEVRDRAGNLASASAPFTLDVTPPALAITEPASAARLGADLVAVIVRYSDDQALDETTLAATLDGAPLELSAGTDTAMTVAGPLADGPHVLEVRLRDRAGNEAAASATFAVDTTRPDLRVADPFAGALLTTATPSVRLVYSDAQGLDLASLRVRIAGQEQSFSVGPDAATLAATPPLPEGEVTIEAEIADLTGNRASVTTTFTVDTIAPEASLAAPQVRFVGTATPELKFALSDAGSGTGVDVASVRVFVDGTEIAATVTPALAIAQAPPLAEGEHQVRVTLSDLAGNAAEATGAFVVDLTPPAVSLVSPVAGSVGNDAEPELRLALVDPQGGEGVLPSGVDPATLRAFVQAGDAPEVEVPFVVTGGEAVARLAAPLPDGTTRLRVQVADVAGHSAEAAFAFDVDTVAPGLFVDAPALDELLATAQPAVALRYTDDRAGIDAARLVLRVDGTEVALSPGETGATGVLPAQGEGRHVLEAEIADRAGNVTSVTGHGFTVDTVAPVLTVAAPLAGAYLGTATPPVQVGWSDATTGVDPPSVRAWLDGIELPVAGATAEGVAFATPPVADGAHVVRVAVADRAGNVGETEVGFFTDTTAPSVPSLEPGDGSYHPQLDEQGRLQVTGQASDLDPRLTVQCRVGDTVVTASLADGAFACAVPLAEGENEVTVTARDGNGHETSRTRTLNLDTKDPEVAIREPQPDAITAATSVDVAFDVTDASPVTASVDGVTAAAEPCAPGAACAFSATGVTVGAGPFATLTASAIDAAGHTGSASVRLRVDRDAPAIEFTKPAAGSFARGAAVDVEGTVLDASAVLVHVNGIPAEVSGGGAFTGQPHAHAFRATVPVADGPAALEVVAWDEAGNSANAQRSITVDSVPPALVITAPAPGLATRATTLEIRGTVSDATAVEVTVDGTAAALAAGEFAFTASLPAEGPRSFVVRARDAAGNVSEATVTVTVDRTPPTLAIATPDEGAIVKALPLAVAGTVTDATGVVVSVQGAAATVAGSAWSAELSLDEGTRTVEVVATDAAGNEVRLARSVQVDLFAPELDVTAPAAGLLTREAAVPVAGSVRDASSVGVTVNGVAATVTGGPCASGCAFGATVELPEGDSQVLVVATDAAGRASEFALPVTRDSTPPTLALVTPEKISAGRPGQAVASVADNLGLQAATLSARVTAECSLGSVSGTGPSLLLDLVVPDCARPGDTVTVTLDATDHAGNAAATSRALRVVADGAIAGQALDAATGLPLAGVEVQAASTNVATGADGRYALPATDSRVVLALARASYSRVERVVEVASGQGTVAVDAFLTPLAQPVTLSEPGTLHVHGGAATCSGADSTCSPSDLRVAVAAPGTYGVTGLSPQALPNLLPLGWSALAALDLSSDGGAATLIASGVAGPLHLARYAPSLHAWVMEAPGVAIVDGVATVALPGAGAFALVVADATEPPLAVPAAGEAFEGLPMVPLPETAASAGRVTPPVIPPTGGTALGAIEIAEAPGVPSGTVVQAEVRETYTLASGEEASTEPRTFDIVVSRQAALGAECPAAALCASFPITPSRSYGPAELTDGRVHLDILAGREGVRGTVGGGSEAVTLAAGDVSVSVPRGALDEDLALAVEAQALSSFLPSNAGLVPLGEFTFDASGATLRAEAQVALAAAVAAGDSAVLVRVERVAGVPYLVVVAALDVEAERVVSRAVPGLPGLREGGRYVAYRIAGPVAFVSGITTASGTPVQARVTGGSLPFHAFTKADGSWVLAAVPGPNALQASVPGTSLAGAATVQVPAPPDVAPPTPIALAGVVTTATVSPADGAVAVAPTASVTIEAAAPIAANSVTAEGVRLVDDATDAAVAVRFVLSTSSRTLSVIPLQALAFATRYRLEAPGLRDTFGGLVQVPITRFTTRADTPPQYDLAAIRFGYPTPEGLVQVTAPAGTLPPGTEILIINSGNGAVVTFTAENDGSLGTTFPADLPATISDTLYVTVTDPLGNVTTFTRSEYVAEDGTTGIGPGGGTVRGEGGVELRVPEGALKKGATFKLALVDPSELPSLFPNAQHETLATSLGAHHGNVLRLEASEGTRLEKEADLVFPLPDFSAVPEAERPTKPEDAFYYIHRRVERCADGSTTCAPENRIVVFEVIDEARAEGEGSNARVVTASPPFFAVAGLLAGTLLLYTMSWSYEPGRLGLPRPGLIRGKALRSAWGSAGASFDAVPDAHVTGTDAGGVALSSKDGGTFATSQTDGTYALWDYAFTGGTTRIDAALGPESASATAFEVSDGPGVGVYNKVAHANITFPAVEPPPAPPQVEIQVVQESTGNLISGVVVSGTSLQIGFRSNTPETEYTIYGARVAGQELAVRQAQEGDRPGWSHVVAETFTPTNPGTYTVEAAAAPGVGSPVNTSTTFRVIAEGGSVEVDPLSPPKVITAQLYPRPNATGVPVTAFLNVAFTEPVRGIPGNVRLLAGEVEIPIRISGVTPDGQVIEAISGDHEILTSLTIQPLAGLRYSTAYRLLLAAGITDLDPEPKPLEPFELLFTTFGPAGVGGTDDRNGSAGIVVLGDRAYLTRTNALVNGNVVVFDITDPVEPVEIGVSEVFAPRPYDIVGEQADTGEKLIAVATGSTNRSKPASVLLFEASTSEVPQFVGAASLTSSAADGFTSRIAIHGGFVYSATVRKGIQGVEIQRAKNTWSGLDSQPNPDLARQKAKTKLNTDGEGFGQDAVVINLPIPLKSNATPYYLNDIKAADISGQTLVAVAGEPGLILAQPFITGITYQGRPEREGTRLDWGYALALGRLQDRDVAVVVGRGTVAGAATTLLITLDVSNPQTPLVLGAVSLSAELGALVPVDILLKDSMALVGGQNSTGDQGFVLLVNLADLATPEVSGRLEGVAGRLALDENGLLYGSARLSTGGASVNGGVKTATLGYLALVKRVAPGLIALDQTSKTAEPVQVEHSVIPPGLEVQSARLELRAGDTTVMSLPAPMTDGAGTVTLPVGTSLDFVSPAVRLVVNPGTAEELVGYPRRLERALMVAEPSPDMDVRVSADDHEVPFYFYSDPHVMRSLEETDDNPVPTVPLSFEVTGSGGSLSPSPAVTSRGLFQTRLKTSTVPGSTYTVMARLPGSDVVATTATVTVVPGAASELALTVSDTALPADEASEATLDLVVKDRYGNAVADGTSVAWLVVGKGTVEPTTSTTTGGAASATYRAGDLAGEVSVVARVDAAEASVDLSLAAITMTVTPSASAMSARSPTPIPVTITASSPAGPPANNAPLTFQGLLGTTELTSGLMNGEATGTFKPFGVEGQGRVVASITTHRDESLIELQAPSGFSVGPVRAGFVGDKTEDGTFTIETLEGETKEFPYRTWTDLTVRGTPGEQVQIRLGGPNGPNVEPIAWYPMDDPLLQGQVADEYHDHPGQAAGNGVSVDYLRKATGAASLYLSGQGEVVVPDNAAFGLAGGIGMATAFLADQAVESTLLSKADSWGLTLVPAGNGVRVRAFVATASDVHEVLSDVVSLEAWHRVIAFLEDGSLRLRVDGQDAGSVAVPDEVVTQMGALTLGKDFVGNLDDVRVWDMSRPKLMAFEDGSYATTVVVGPDGTATVRVRSLGKLRTSSPNVWTVEIISKIEAANGSEQASFLRVWAVEMLVSIVLMVDGFIVGDPETVEAYAGDMIASFLVYGDVRDLVIGIYRHFVGAATTGDYVVLTLAVVGLITTIYPPGDIAAAGAKAGAKLLKQLPEPVQRLIGQYLVGAIRDFLNGSKEKLREAAVFLGVLVTSIGRLVNISTAIKSVEHVRSLIRVAVNSGSPAQVLERLDNVFLSMQPFSGTVDRLTKEKHLADLIDMMARHSDASVNLGLGAAQAWSENAMKGAIRFLDVTGDVNKAKRTVELAALGRTTRGWHPKVADEFFDYVRRLPNPAPGAEDLLGKTLGTESNLQGAYLMLRALSDAPEVANFAAAGKLLETVGDRVAMRRNVEGVDYIFRRADTLLASVGYPMPVSNRVPELWELKYVEDFAGVFGTGEKYGKQLVKHLVERVAPVLDALNAVPGLTPAQIRSELAKVRLKYNIVMRQGPNTAAAVAADKALALQHLNNILNASTDKRIAALRKAGFSFDIQDVFLRRGDPLVTPVASLTALTGP